MKSALLNRRRDLIPSIGIAVGAMLWGLFWLPVRGIESAGVSVMWTVPVIFASVTLLFLPVEVEAGRPNLPLLRQPPGTRLPFA